MYLDLRWKAYQKSVIVKKKRFCHLRKSKCCIKISLPVLGISSKKSKYFAGGFGALFYVLQLNIGVF